MTILYCGPQLLCVPPDEAREWWHFVQRYVRCAVERGGVSKFEDIEADVLSGRSLLWIVWGADQRIKAVVVTELTTVANGARVCTIVACGGSGRGEWLHLIDGLEKYARTEQCAVMRIHGRRGWQRVLAGHDYRRVPSGALEKELS